MFSQASVCSRVWGGQYHQMHHGIVPIAGYLSPPQVQVEYAPRHQTRDPLLVTSGGDHWRPVQTCLFGTPPHHGVTSVGGH